MTVTDRAYYSKSLGAKRPHFHDCHQVILITGGSAEFTINGRVSPAGAGDAVILSRFENHSVKILSDSYLRYILHVDPDDGSHDGSICQFLANRPAGFENIIKVGDDTPRLARLFERIIAEDGGERLASQMRQLLINELIIEIYRHTPPHIGFELYEDREIYELQLRLERDYDKSHTLSSLAKQYSMSVSSLAHKFKKVTGSSVMDYLLSCRMAQAKRLLVSTALSVDEVVSRCGFSDSSNFCRSFKAQTGLTPSAFRKEYKKGL